MGVQIYNTATEYAANALTITRGTVADIVSVGVFHTTDAAHIPTTAEFTLVTLVQPGDPLAEGNLIDVLSLIGPRGDFVLAPGVYQRWVWIKTATEDIIRRPDTIEVL